MDAIGFGYRRGRVGSVFKCKDAPRKHNERHRYNVTTKYGDSSHPTLYVAEILKIIEWNPRDNRREFALKVANYSTVLEEKGINGVKRTCYRVNTQRYTYASGEFTSIQNGTSSRRPLMIPRARHDGAGLHRHFWEVLLTPVGGEDESGSDSE